VAASPVFEVDADGARLDDRAAAPRCLFRRLSEARLDVRADGDAHCGDDAPDGSDDFRERSGFAVGKAQAVGDAGARRRDGREARRLDNARRRRVPGVAEQENPGSLMKGQKPGGALALCVLHRSG
jgi:hypothetical protein